MDEKDSQIWNIYLRFCTVKIKSSGEQRVESTRCALLPSPRREYKQVKNLSKNYKNTLLSATEKLPLRQKTRQLYPECFKRISIKTFTGGSLVPHLWQIFSKRRAAVFPSPGGVSMLEIIAGLIPVRLAGDNGKPIHVFLSNRFHSRPCVRKLLVSFF